MSPSPRTPSHRDTASCRSSLYGRLADLLDYPTEATVAAYNRGDLATNIVDILAGLSYPLRLDADALRGEATTSELGSEYIRLFDVASDGKVAPLYGGVYSRSRQQTMEEMLRLYRLFGLTTASAAYSDMPDSLLTVLEFLHFLAAREALASSEQDIQVLRRVQYDLLEQHVSRWTPQIVERVARLTPIGLYDALVRLLDDLVVSELTALKDLPLEPVGSLPKVSTGVRQ